MPISSIEVEVWTRDEDYAGTDGDVRCVVQFNGAPDLDVEIDVSGVDNFERGAKEVFPIGPLPPAVAALSPGDVTGLRIRTTSGNVWKAAAVGLRVNGQVLLSRWTWTDLPQSQIIADRRPGDLLDGLELRLETGDIPNGGTDDSLYCSIRLISGADIVTDLPLDYPSEDDFEAGATRRYLIPLPSVLEPPVTPADLARLTIRKGGTNGWLLGGATLFANGIVRFRNRAINQFLDNDSAVLGFRAWRSDRVVGPALGGLGDTFARIQCRVEAPGPIEARLTAPSGAVAVAQATLNPAGVIQVNGLVPDTSYDYELLRDGVAIPGASGTLRTFPSETMGARFPFAFGSCVRNKYDTIQAGWEQLRRLAPGREGPRLFLHLGDTFYFYDDDVLETGDVGDAVDVERAALAANLSSRLHPSFLRMARHLPTVAVWDDHDFRGDGSEGADFGERDILRDAFLSYWGNPDLGASWRRFGLTSRLTFGRADLYLMDCRFNRSRAAGEFFGPGQIELVLGSIDDRAKSLGPRLVIVASGGPWNSRMDADDPYAETEYRAERKDFFERLATRVGDDRIRGLVFLSGDVHRAEIYEIEIADGVVVPELVSSALAMPHNPTGTSSASKELKFSRGVDADDGSYANFCCVAADTTAAEPNRGWSLTVDFRRSDNGEVFFTKQYQLDDNQFRW